MITLDGSGGGDFLDANTILRYLIRDTPGQSERASALIEADTPLRISVVVLAEVGFVLTKFYRVNRALAVDTMMELLNRENIEVHEIANDLAVEALLLCRPSGRVSFTDALLWATARAGGGKVWSFDRKFPRDGIHVDEP